MPSTRSSFTPVTVTVWAMSQFADVKVRVDGETVASPVSPEVTSITTSVAGWASNTTVKVSVDPVSAISVELLDSATENPATSSSVVVTEIV